MRSPHSILVITLLLALLVSASWSLGLFAYVVLGMEELPAPEPQQTSRFYYRNQELMTTRFDENRTLVTMEDIPEEVIWATVAAEDQRFFAHRGFDLAGIVRAAFQNLQQGRIAQGGSTITQQLAKNLYLSHDRTWERKLREAVLTLQLEQTRSKEQILEQYLNTIYYGHSTYGIEAAAHFYFDKPAARLSLGEAALLAGLPRGPAHYSPFIDEEAARERQQAVLDLMHDAGYITSAERKTARAQELSFNDDLDLSREANYIVDRILATELAEIVDADPEVLHRGGLELHTTIDPHMQEVAERLLAEDLPVRGEDDQGVTQPQAALVALEPDTGKILALAGGLDYQETMLNRAYLPRSPGSAFKPLVYAAALEHRYTAAHTFSCEPVSLTVTDGEEPYEPTCYGGSFHHREFTLREALARSCNITAVRLNRELGSDRTVEMARRLGIDSPLEANLSLPLGSSEVTLVEITAAYAAFANGGYRVEPVLLEQASGPGDEILVANAPGRQRVLDEEVAYLMTDLLRGVFQGEGTAASASPVLDRPAAGKTGTAQDGKNVYLVGYTPDLVVGLYIGDDQGQPLQETGGSLAAPLWAQFVVEASRDLPPRDFPRPPGLEEHTLCPETLLLQSPDCTAPGQAELFIPGTAPREDCSREECPHIQGPPWWHWDFWF